MTDDRYSPFAPEVVTALKQRLDPDRVMHIAAGPQKGVPYLSGYNVIFHANRIFGFGNWGYDITESPRVIEQGDPEGKGDVWACRMRLTVRGAIPVEDYGTCTRSGRGSAALEMAFKGCVTDAIKRCLVAFGDQFGLELRDKDLPPAHDEHDEPQETEWKGRGTPPAKFTPKRETFATLRERLLEPEEEQALPTYPWMDSFEKAMQARAVSIKTVADYLHTTTTVDTYAAIDQWIRDHKKPAGALVISAIDAAINTEGGGR